MATSSGYQYRPADPSFLLSNPSMPCIIMG